MTDSDGLRLHVIHERDVGLFSLIQQVVAHLPWAMAEGRTPVVFFTDRCAYFHTGGYNGGDTVWEYYFEPLVADVGAAAVPDHVRKAVADEPLPARVTHRIVDPGDHLISREFGRHRELRGKMLSIPFRWEDPDVLLRQITAPLFERYVRPRAELAAKVEEFARSHFAGRFVIGVHARGTDAVSSSELRPFRRNSLILDNFLSRLERLLEAHGDAVIFVATDDQASLDRIAAAFGDRVVACDSLRHTKGPAAGKGPTGDLMPAYIATDRQLAARNGEEAVIEWLLLCHADHLVHNGASLARTALLAKPQLPHTNVHLESKPVAVRVGAAAAYRSRKIARKLARLLSGEPRRRRA